MTLQADELIREASRVTGLNDLGAEPFRAGFARLVHAINNEAELNAMGLEAQRGRLLGLLANRLRLEAAYRAQPEIAQEPIAAPIVIVGLPRTGSTMTHRLLASDPDHTAMLWWEGRHPAMLPGEVRGQPEERRALGLAEVEAVMAASPEAMDIHPWDFEGADEEVILLEHTFHSSVAESFMHLPSYSAWVASQDHRPIYEELRRMLQQLQWQSPDRAGKRWVLKSPHHLRYMSALLEVFPDARIIQTHRTPLDTVPSFCSMCASLAAPLTDTLDAARIGRHWLDKLSVDLARCMDVAEAHPESFLHLKFQDMVKDPISQMESVYHFTGESFGDRAEQAMRAYREDDAHQPGAHQYSLDDFGLDGEEISRRFARYIDRYELA